MKAGAMRSTRSPGVLSTPNTTPKAVRSPAGPHLLQPPRTGADMRQAVVLSDYQNNDGVENSGDVRVSKKEGKANYQNVRDKDMTSYIQTKLKLNIVPAAPSTSGDIYVLNIYFR